MLPLECPWKFYFPAVGTRQSTGDEKMKRMVTGLRKSGKSIFTKIDVFTSAVRSVYHFMAAFRKSVNAFKNLFRYRHKQRSGETKNTMNKCKISNCNIFHEDISWTLLSALCDIESWILRISIKLNHSVFVKENRNTRGNNSEKNGILVKVNEFEIENIVWSILVA